MATLVLRAVKGSPLTNQEVDGNFSNILSDVGVVSALSTTAKSNIVAAVNEIVRVTPTRDSVIALTIALGS
jgi:hypothetical protein